MFDYISNNWAKYTTLLTQHLSITLTALSLCVVLGIGLGALCYRSKTFDRVATSVASALRVVPSIATMLILMPLMGTGLLPAIAALTILGLPPVIINTALALQATDESILEAAEACGMDESRIFWGVRLPLALPLIITGLRISGLSVAAGAILAAYIGAGGLGELILSGLSQYRMDMLLAGAVTTMAISLCVEGFFQVFHIVATRHRSPG